MTVENRPEFGVRISGDPALNAVRRVPIQVPRDKPRSPVGFKLISGDVATTATVSVVIPALNEAKNLPHVLASLPEWIDEVLLVDGGSADDTVCAAQRLRPGIKVIHQTGRGKGDALLTGFAACTTDIIVAMDADGSTDGAEVARFVAILLAGADFAKGSRFACGGGSSDITALRRFGNRVLVGLVNTLFRTRYTDLCYGFNAFWARHLAALDLQCTGFEVETLMNIRAAECGMRVHEVASHEHARAHGSSNLRVVRDGLRIAGVILREWHRRGRARTAARWWATARPVAVRPPAAPPVAARPPAARPVAARPVAAPPVAAESVAAESVAARSAGEGD